MSERAVILLGPQRERPGVRKAVADLGLFGPLAVVTAGWEEREGRDQELARELAEQNLNLGLFPRAQDCYRSHPEVFELMIEREVRRKELRDLYHLRLSPQLEVCRGLLGRVALTEPDALYAPEVDHAIEGVRELDRHHLSRVSTLEAEIVDRLAAGEFSALVRHRHEIAELLASSTALLIAGGHVGTLVSLMRMFDVMGAATDKPVVAWSAGAMAIGERVVLFHDSPARGAGDPEVFGPGFGLVAGVVPLPHANHRLELDDPHRVALMARRFAPDVCVGLDYTGRIDRVGGGHDETAGATDIGSNLGWRASGGASVLRESGDVITTASDEPAPEPHPVDGEEQPLLPSDPRQEVETLVEAARRGPGELGNALEARNFPIVGDGWALYVFVGQADGVKLHHWVSGLPSAPPWNGSSAPKA